MNALLQSELATRSGSEHKQRKALHWLKQYRCLLKENLESNIMQTREHNMSVTYSDEVLGLSDRCTLSGIKT